MQALNDEDIELEERIQSIMQQRDGLSDKEFIDFTLSYLRGQKDEEIKIEEGKTESSFCMHPIGEDDGDKLIKLLKKSDDLLLYFIKLKGLMVLRDSFSYNNVGFKVLEQILQKNDKVKEEFQKVKGYEAMIDYLHNRSLSPEKVSLDSDIVYQVFNMLEEATINDYCRGQLSEKKKIKDLFIAVLKALDVKENTKLFGTLISFGSNLCFGKYETKFRELLKKDFGDLINELIVIINFIIDGIKEDYKEEDQIKELKQKKLKKRQKRELTEREGDLKKRVHDRILLKQITCGFISNLSVDKTFRKFFAADEFLEYVIELIRIEKERKNFDWVDSIERILGVLANLSLIESAQEYF